MSLNAKKVRGLKSAHLFSLDDFENLPTLGKD